MSWQGTAQTTPANHNNNDNWTREDGSGFFHRRARRHGRRVCAGAFRLCIRHGGDVVLGLGCRAPHGGRDVGLRIADGPVARGVHGPAQIPSGHGAAVPDRRRGRHSHRRKPAAKAGRHAVQALPGLRSRDFLPGDAVLNAHSADPARRPRGRRCSRRHRRHPWRYRRLHRHCADAVVHAARIRQGQAARGDPELQPRRAAGDDGRLYRQSAPA